jgi:hypothetical protein
MQENIKVGLKVRRQVVNWTDLVQNRHQCRTFMTTDIYLWVSET